MLKGTAAAAARKATAVAVTKSTEERLIKQKKEGRTGRQNPLIIFFRVGECVGGGSFRRVKRNFQPLGGAKKSIEPDSGAPQLSFTGFLFLVVVCCCLSRRAIPVESPSNNIKDSLSLSGELPPFLNKNTSS